MAKFKALLFDLDGTLVDSEHFHFSTWNELLAESDVQLEYDDFLKNYAGIPPAGNAARIKELYDIAISLEELTSRKEDLNVARLKTSVIGLMPFVQSSLDYFVQKGLVMALVTASKRADVDEMLKNNGLAKYLDVLVTRSDVERSKPDPQSYNLAVEKVGFRKEECLVFEDTLNGLRAAKAAGLVCYIIQANPEDHEKLSAADKIFLNFEEATNYLIENELI